SALGIDWGAGRPHITCPYPDHADAHPSWRWDEALAKAFCTCSQGDGIIDVVMKVEGLDFPQAKVRIAEILQRDDLIGTTGDPLWFLHPWGDKRDDALPRDYLAYRLGLPPGEVLMPATPVAGWRSLGYYEGSRAHRVGDFPCAVFGLANCDRRVHGFR